MKVVEKKNSDGGSSEKDWFIYHRVLSHVYIGIINDDYMVVLLPFVNIHGKT